MADEQDPKDESTPPTPPEAAADKPADPGAGLPELKGEVSRTSAPSAGVSAAPAPSKVEGPAPSKVEGPAPSKVEGLAPSKVEGPPPARPPAPPRPSPPGQTAAAPAHPAAPAPASGPVDPPPPADASVPAFITELQAKLPGAVEQVSFWVGDWTVIVAADRLLDVARHLRDAARFDYCSDVTASDWPPRAKRFDVIYCLFSTTRRQRVRIKVRAGDADPVPSVAGLWPAANWLEREVYDMFGVRFVGHPDLRRILMPDEWQGYPERKDYPLEGPGELLMENPLDWLRLRTAHDTADIE